MTNTRGYSLIDFFFYVSTYSCLLIFLVFLGIHSTEHERARQAEVMGFRTSAQYFTLEMYKC